MQPEAAFIRADGAGKLHAVTGIHVYLTGIVDPRHAEFDLPLRVYEPLQQRIAPERGFIFRNHRAQGIQYLPHRLMELRFVRILAYHAFDHFVYVGHIQIPPFFGNTIFTDHCVNRLQISVYRCALN